MNSTVTPQLPAQLSICGVQLHCIPGDTPANLASAENLIRQNPGHHLYVLPELSSTGYSDHVFQHRASLAEDALTGPSHSFFAPLATELGCYIVYGILRRSPTNANIYISQVVLAPNQQQVTTIYYDKMHLCDMGACSEVAHGVSRGDVLPCVFAVQGVRIGVCICYDLRFPELWRHMAWEQGADVILHPSAFVRDATFPSWHPFVCTRALENQVYVLSISHAGEEYGGSLAHPPVRTKIGLKSQYIRPYCKTCVHY